MVNKDTVIWHYTNIYPTATMGENVVIGSYVEIGEHVEIGNNVRIGSGAFIPEGVVIEDDVFIAPHVCFTNDRDFPSEYRWRELPPTVVKRGAAIGANATILPNIVIGENARIGAGSVVVRSVSSNITVKGNPAR